MKRTRWRSHGMALGLTLVALGALGVPGPGRNAEELCPELEILRPFLGAWAGKFQGTEGTDAGLEIRNTWTSILNGQAVKESRTIAEMGFEAEGVYYYDRQTGAVSYLTVTNNGYVSRGQTRFDGEQFVQTGTQVAPDSSVRSTEGVYRFRDDGTLVNEGGHVIVFRRR
jgi:hypothetical protein